MILDYYKYLPEHQDELEVLSEDYRYYFLTSVYGETMTEKEFILHRASPQLLKALKELEVKRKRNEIEQDFKKD